MTTAGSDPATSTGLVVIAAEDAPPPPPGVLVVRFAGAPPPGETFPADLPSLRDEAAAIIKRSYPGWLDGWAKSSGAMTLAVWEGELSWWWYGALSERSPQLSVLIHQLHRLVLLRLMLRRRRTQTLTWYDTSSEMLRAVERVAAAEGCAAVLARVGKPPREERIPAAIAARLAAVLRDLARCVAARLMGGKGRAGLEAKVVGFTRFPVLWERTGEVWRERMLGRLPELLEARGMPIAYAALMVGSPRAWLRNGKAWRAAIREKRIRLLNAYATAGDVFTALAPVRLWWRYWRWRRTGAPWQSKFEGLDVGGLLRAAMDQNVLDANLGINRLIARALPRLLSRSPNVRHLVYPFEFQPMERAASIAAQAAGEIKVVGLQTGLFTSGQMGCIPRREELRLTAADRKTPERAPVPDLVAAYGRLPFRIFADALGAERVVEVGATRYGGLAEFAAVPYESAKMRRALGIPERACHVLFAATALPEEALPMVHAARTIAAARPDVFLSFKFHYHLQLDALVARLLAGVADGRWKIFDSDLHGLIRASDYVVTGASSVAYEALVLGRRPLVYLSSAAFHCNPAAETPSAFSFWSSSGELLTLLGEDAHPQQHDVADALRDQIELIAEGDHLLIDAMLGKTMNPRRETRIGDPAALIIE